MDIRLGMHSIGAVARQTGIQISTLRKWEARYGYPRPARSASGRRDYADDVVEKLREVARRVAGGERASKVIPELFADPGRVTHVAAIGQATAASASLVETALALLSSPDLSGFRLILERARSETTMLGFVEGFAASLTREVGVRWAKGRLPIYREHLFSTLLEVQLERETALFNTDRLPPTVLLAIPAGEKHTLGLAMTHAVLSEAGISCLRLPSDLPCSEIAAAALAYGVSAVGLSASMHYPPRLLSQQIFGLRAQLGDNIELWLGGNGMHRVSSIPCGTQAFTTWPTLIERCNALQTQRSNKETP